MSSIRKRECSKRWRATRSRALLVQCNGVIRMELKLACEPPHPRTHCARNTFRSRRAGELLPSTLQPCPSRYAPRSSNASAPRSSGGLQPLISPRGEKCGLKPEKLLAFSGQKRWIFLPGIESPGKVGINGIQDVTSTEFRKSRLGTRYWPHGQSTDGLQKSFEESSKRERPKLQQISAARHLPFLRLARVVSDAHRLSRTLSSGKCFCWRVDKLGE